MKIDIPCKIFPIKTKTCTHYELAFKLSLNNRWPTSKSFYWEVTATVPMRPCSQALQQDQFSSVLPVGGIAVEGGEGHFH